MFDEANAHRRCALRQAQLGLHIYLYTRYSRACAQCWYTLQDTLRRRVFTYQSDDSLSHRGTALSVDRPRKGTRIFLAFWSVADLFIGPRMDDKTIFFYGSLS